MVAVLLAVAAYVFAIQAIRAQRLIVSALWLAGVSALLAVLFYLMGAYAVAAIELSVGAGLVTVLFVFAINVAGEEMMGMSGIVPRLLVAVLLIGAVLLLGWLALPQSPIQAPPSEPSLPAFVWGLRGLDVLVQIVLIFSGVLGLLGLLAEAKAPLRQPVAEQVAAQRERELVAMEQKVLPSRQPVAASVTEE
jgi:NADH:ubiquinone oxidoreductase subunit 6 (subunit J)